MCQVSWLVAMPDSLARHLTSLLVPFPLNHGLLPEVEKNENLNWTVGQIFAQCSLLFMLSLQMPSPVVSPEWQSLLCQLSSPLASLFEEDHLLEIRGKALTSPSLPKSLSPSAY